MLELASTCKQGNDFSTLYWHHITDSSSSKVSICIVGVTLWQGTVWCDILTSGFEALLQNKRFNFCQHLSPCDEELLEWATIITDHYHRSWWLNRYMCMLFASQALTHQLYLVSTPVTSICWKAVLFFSTANIADWLCILTQRLKHCFLQTSRTRMVSLRPEHSGHWGHDPLTSPT